MVLSTWTCLLLSVCKGWHLLLKNSFCNLEIILAQLGITKLMDANFAEDGFKKMLKCHKIQFYIITNSLREKFRL